MDLLNDDKVHTTPRMVKLVEFYEHVIKLNKQGMNGEGFLGTIQLVVPIDFKGAKVQYQEGDEGDGDTRFAVLTAKTAHKEPLFFVGDGQGRLVGLFSLERSAEEKIDQYEKDIKKLSKSGADTTAAMQALALAKSFRDEVHRFLSANQLAFVCYVGGVAADGTVTGLDTEAQNAFTSKATPSTVTRVRKRSSSTRASPR